MTAELISRLTHCRVCHTNYLTGTHHSCSGTVTPCGPRCKGKKGVVEGAYTPETEAWAESVFEKEKERANAIRQAKIEAYEDAKTIAGSSEYVEINMERLRERIAALKEEME